MNTLRRMKDLQDLAMAQGGCLTSDDLLTALSMDHHSSLRAAIKPFLDAGKLIRVKRGLYVWEGALPHAAIARICPTATLSFGNVLADELLIGTVPNRHYRFTGACTEQSIQTPHWTATIHRLGSHLQFGWHLNALGHRVADREKAALDCLYYSQKGLTFSFDLETDIDRQGLGRERFLDYLSKYPNPRFQSRCRRWLDAV